MILSYRQHILLENSKNDPIPEINKKDHLGVVVIGPPGAGKSTFVDDWIIGARNRNFKVFDPDQVSYLKSRDHNKWEPGTSDRTVRYIKSAAPSGENVIYISTGNSVARNVHVVDILKENGYDVIFIHLFPSYDLTVSRTWTRKEQGRHDATGFVKKERYLRNLKQMNLYIQQDISGYYVVKPSPSNFRPDTDDSFVSDTYEFYKYDGKLLHTRTYYGQYSELGSLPESILM